MKDLSPEQALGCECVQSTGPPGPGGQGEGLDHGNWLKSYPGLAVRTGQ